MTEEHVVLNNTSLEVLAGIDVLKRLSMTSGHEDRGSPSRKSKQGTSSKGYSQRRVGKKVVSVNTSSRRNLDGDVYLPRQSRSPLTKETEGEAGDLIISSYTVCEKYHKIILRCVKQVFKTEEDKSKDGHNIRGKKFDDKKSRRKKHNEVDGASAVTETSKKNHMKGAFDAEISLWVYLKSLLNNDGQQVVNKAVYEYLNGFYQSLYHSIKLAWNQENHKESGEKRDDEGHYRLDHHLFFSHPINLALKSRMDLKQFFESEDAIQDDSEKYYRLLNYNILIRLGDLNRYLKYPDVAIGYYSQARDVNPLRGHAFNQLALMSDKDKNPGQQVYYYIRALCCLEDPVMISAHNIQSSVNRLIHLREQQQDFDNIRGKNVVSLFQKRDDALDNEDDVHVDPRDVSNWLHTLVIGIFNKKTGMIIRPLLTAAVSLLHDMREAFPRDQSHVLQALDVLLEHCLNPTYSGQCFPFLRKQETLLTALQHLIDSITGLDDVDPETLKVALPHDYSLVGFKHLKEIHAKFSWSDAPDVIMNTPDKFLPLLKRIQSNLKKLLSHDVYLATRPQMTEPLRSLVNFSSHVPVMSRDWNLPPLGAYVPIGRLVDLNPVSQEEVNPSSSKSMKKLVSDGQVLWDPVDPTAKTEKEADKPVTPTATRKTKSRNMVLQSMLSKD